MFKTQNIKKHKITSTIGTLFLLADLVYFVFPFFNNEFESSVVMLFAGGLLGGGFLLMPDDLIKTLMKKKQENE